MIREATIKSLRGCLQTIAERRVIHKSMNLKYEPSSEPQMIREATIESLRGCLQIIAERDTTVKRKWYSLVFQVLPFNPKP